MIIVADASVVIAALLDGGATGDWAAEVLSSSAALVAPHLMPVEAANIRARLVGSPGPRCRFLTRT